MADMAGRGTSTAAPIETSSSASPLLAGRGPLADAAVGAVLAIAFVILGGAAAARGWMGDSNLGLLLSYLAVWVPLGGAVVAAGFFRGSWMGIRSLAGALGLRFTALDLLWGLTIGLLARVVASVLEIAVYGGMAQGEVVLGVPVYDGWWLFGALLAPVLLAPFIEEIFFRGLLLRAVEGAVVRGSGGVSRRLALGIAVGVSGVVFALVHVVGLGSVDAVVVVGLSTLVFGLAAGSVAAVTGRLGGAIVAHVTFNALVVVPAVLG